jgi:hypothetical protein
MCIAISRAIEPIVAKSTAAVAVSRARETRLMANPATNGTSRSMTGPIAWVAGISATKKPPSPTAAPTSPPTRTPFSEFFQSISAALPSGWA